MRPSLLIHRATIRRPPQTITDKKLATGAPAVIALDVPCRIMPLVDAEAVSVLGIGTSETYRGFWQDDVDLKDRDEIEWQGLKLVVISLLKTTPQDDVVREVSTILERRKAS